MKKQTLLFLLMLMPLMMSASTKINGIYYNLNSTDKIAEVTSVPSGTSKYTGSIVIPNIVTYGEVTYSVTSIGGSAFHGCSGLTSITIPKSVSSIGMEAFYQCSGLTSVTIPNSVTSIGEGAFYGCSSLTSVTIPNSVTSIGSAAFEGCSSLISVTIPNNVTSILDYAFHACSSLTSVTIPNSVTSIREGAFFACSSLTSVTIPNSVTTIGEMAFYGCSGLTSVTIGSGMISIRSKAFSKCTELEDMYCYAVNVPALISSDTFEDTNNIKWGTLYVPEESVELYKKSTWIQYFGNIVAISGGSGLEKCAKPIVTLLANGKVKMESATEGATCLTNITASNAEPLTDGEISLNTPLTVYTVTSYATAEGYEDSDVATATFRYEKAEGDVNGDGVVNISDVIQLVNMILTAESNSNTSNPEYETKTALLTWENMIAQSYDNSSYNNMMVGDENDEANGFSIVITGNLAKSYSSAGTPKLDIEYNGEMIQHTAIKLSNGAQNTIFMPKGAKATKLSIYSITGTNASNRKSYWKEVAGVSYNETTTTILDLDAPRSNPNKVDFTLDNVPDKVTFTNTGEQQCVILYLEYHFDKSDGK